MALKKRPILKNTQVEELMGEPGWKQASASRVRQVEAAIRAAAVKRRGGARPGAGRKPSGRIPATMRILPATRAYLTKQAGSPRGIGAVVDRLVAEKALRK